MRRLAKSGRNVVVCDLNVERGEALANELGASVAFTKTDVSSEKDVWLIDRPHAFLTHSVGANCS